MTRARLSACEHSHRCAELPCPALHGLGTREGALGTLGLHVSQSEDCGVERPGVKKKEDPRPRSPSSSQQPARNTPRASCPDVGDPGAQQA